ncbi:MAG TPA: ferritin-like domain-containing protein [Candidatus Thermoplasmatota archaeon]|nr:ferritin-like domain-containing protein [Candidatus Thermoplasmatota archaeon]
MGTKGRELLGNKVDHILELLNNALADEWLAYYQYWIGAKVVVGPMKGEVEGELIEHANDELRHADMLVERILQLGGTPIIDPKEWYKKTNCGYDAPIDPNVYKILDQNIKGEQCAISVYSKLLKETMQIDPVTYQIVVEILRDEEEHEEDLEGIVEDLENLTK